MSPTLTIRPATRADLSAAAAIEASVFDDNAYPAFFFRQALDVMGGLFLVAVDEHEAMAGYVIGALEAWCSDAWVMSIAVDASFRRQGVAAALTTRVCDRFAERGARRVLLTVEPDNDAAIAFYHKAGFREIASEPDYFGEGHARFVMAKELG